MHTSAVQLVTPDMIDRVLRVTDTFALDRDAVIVPIKSEAREGSATVLPDGKLVVHPPPDGAVFETWLAGLPGVLATLDLRRTRRA